jgi:putative FmdB family regulatory protein
MPLFDYHCKACDTTFELLVRAGTVLACPHCQSGDLEKTVSRLAPAGRIEAIRLAHRRAAHAQGLFSHYSAGEQVRLLRGKRV